MQGLGSSYPVLVFFYRKAVVRAHDGAETLEEHENEGGVREKCLRERVSF